MSMGNTKQKDSAITEEKTQLSLGPIPSLFYSLLDLVKNWLHWVNYILFVSFNSWPHNPFVLQSLQLAKGMQNVQARW